MLQLISVYNNRFNMRTNLFVSICCPCRSQTQNSVSVSFSYQEWHIILHLYTWESCLETELNMKNIFIVKIKINTASQIFTNNLSLFIFSKISDKMNTNGK